MIELRPYQQVALQQIISALKENDDPVLLECSVGGGKSYLIGSVARLFEEKNKRVLCLVSSSELVRNNSEAFKELGGNPSVFCSSLDEKSWDKNIVFATPQSVINGIKRSQPIANIIFNMIIVDECHHINYHAKNSTLMRVLRHYKQEYNPMRLLGLSGTPFRGSESICGEHAIFKKKLGNISTQYLIEHGYLVKPVFGITETEGFDFSKCKAQNTGEFKGSDLQRVIDEKKRLTYDILQEVQKVMKNRNVAVIFCSTKAHCYEALRALPDGEAKIILGDTDSQTRHEILTAARRKEIKYLISVNCLMTGVNVPAIDLLVWLRPTSSLLLYIQGIGRGLRLSEGKEDCLVLDFSGNLTRFQDFDDPIINEAIQPKEENEKEYCIQCPACMAMNTEYSRRCIGITNEKRCDYFFEFKECSQCQTQNDIASRYCRDCEGELIDPNAKLSLSTIKPDLHRLMVLEARYGLSGTTTSFRVNCAYTCQDNHKNIVSVYEFFTPTNSEKAKNVFYGQFVKKSVSESSKYYPYLTNRNKVQEMLNDIRTPLFLNTVIEKNYYKIKSKVFEDTIE